MEKIGGLKWATTNIGASNIYQNGLYFAWAETTGYSSPSSKSGGFTWGTTKYSNSSSGNSWSKYNASDRIDNLQLSDDAARQNWGGSWRMPTYSEWEALVNNTTQQWVTNYNGSGVTGTLFTSGSKSIFFPASGWFDATNHANLYVQQRYWLTRLHLKDDGSGIDRAYCSWTTSSGATVEQRMSRYRGVPIRPVIG